jgi:hypothetical protein
MCLTHIQGIFLGTALLEIKARELSGEQVLAQPPAKFT